jgi:hypothetical protein
MQPTYKQARQLLPDVSELPDRFACMQTQPTSIFSNPPGNLPNVCRLCSPAALAMNTLRHPSRCLGYFALLVMLFGSNNLVATLMFKDRAEFNAISIWMLIWFHPTMSNARRTLAMLPVKVWQANGQH